MDDTRRVTCSECGGRSEIMTPPEGAGEVVWKCPKPLENGVDMCGTLNTTTA